ncbi:hypothetical protein HMN09_01395900 [Mycena chlorophos]|uniref:Uncharacterized protein n=1 Tax=Mycena chlorophos TaxID=658473 RepID=A0A8H6RY52_MYCCL|nr:hypothetical protein HMN09_01395900 [Mycena chlorophos]
MPPTSPQNLPSTNSASRLARPGTTDDASSTLIPRPKTRLAMASMSAATAIFAIFSIFSVLLMILGFVVASKVSEQFRIPARWLMILVGLSCLNEAINAIVWADNADLTPAGGAFCEVSIRIRMLACIGIPAAVFAATLKVYKYITLFRDGEPMAYERCILETSKADLWLCILPGPLYILVQSANALLGHRRFAILEGVGCVYIPATSTGSVLCTIGVVALFAFVALVFGLVTLSRWAGQREALRRDISRPGRAFLVRTVMLPIVLMPLVLGSLILTLFHARALNALFSSAPGPSFALAQSATGIAVLPRAVWAARDWCPSLRRVGALGASRRARDRPASIPPPRIRRPFARLYCVCFGETFPGGC